MCDITHQRGEFVHPCALTDHPLDGERRVVHLAVQYRLSHGPDRPLSYLAHGPVTWTTSGAKPAG